MPDEIFLFKSYLGPAITLVRGKEAQAACADRAGVSVVTWSKWENGRATPRHRHLTRLLRGLACDQLQIEMAILQVMTDHLIVAGVVDSERHSFGASLEKLLRRIQRDAVKLESSIQKLLLPGTKC